MANPNIFILTPRYYAVTLGLLLMLEMGWTQNLVINPSLEQFQKGFPRAWRVVAGTPDIYLPYAAQRRLKGTRTRYIRMGNYSKRFKGTLSGEACFVLGMGKDHSEIIEATLSDTLLPGRIYNVSLWVIRQKQFCDTSLYFIPVYFSKRKLPKVHVTKQLAVRYLELRAEKFPLLDSQERWMKVSGKYLAKGGEQFIAIGSFVGANKEVLAHAKIPLPDGKFTNGLYYVFDALSVSESESIDVLPLGTKLAMDHVFFISGKATFSRWSSPALRDWVQVLREHPNLNVQINGHTDDVGSAEENLQLSDDRAKAVYEYFISKGIDKDRLRYKGFGETRFISDNQTSEGRRQNRRVELEIIDP